MAPKSRRDKLSGTFRPASPLPEDQLAKTIVYVHGIGNKPTASILKCQWDLALFQREMGDRARMAYWVNREYYPTPEVATCASGDKVEIDEVDLLAVGPHGSAAGFQATVEAESEPSTVDPAQAAIIERIRQRMFAHVNVDLDRQLELQSRVSAEILPLPPVLRGLLTDQLTGLFLRDVNDFLFHRDRREHMERSLRERLDPASGPFVVVAHSQGTMIAYNVLRTLDEKKIQVPLFVTIGSPLGIQEVQDVLTDLAGSKSLPIPACVKRWLNVADRLDPVATSPHLAGCFYPQQSIEDHVRLMLNPDSPRHPHSGTGYLSTEVVRLAVRSAVHGNFAAPVHRFTVAGDLASDLENSLDTERHAVLIELADNQAVAIQAQSREAIVHFLQGLERGNAGQCAIEPLRRYVAARLTRDEVSHLTANFKSAHVARLWRNSAKQALVLESIHTIQAAPAHISYGALGEGITWAVLDTGIAEHHPHFQTHQTVIEQWDCTPTGNAVLGATDKQGHGTHVAGIIAGAWPKPTDFAHTGIAPRAKLVGYKVLDDTGNGRDASIIKALEHVAEKNERSPSLVIHGLNLSLGGNFDPKVFGCGHTPLCEELRRVWNQGVLICIACGNAGFATLLAAGRPIQANMAISVGDPANLEEAIAVGSVHKTNPNTYGISYFSSRGPTADGRLKPDVVAPGEHIESASHRYLPPGVGDATAPYISLSGTSMAAPHVSGMLACLLSRRRELIGYPDRAKQILLDNCTDLGRERYSQGHGLPNLVRMLMNT